MATAGLSIPSQPRKSARWVDLPDHVAQALGVGVVGASRVHGGDVAASFAIELADGRRVFAKTHPNAPPGFFTTEAAGLRWLREPGVVPVPEVLAVSDDPPFLVLEWIEEGRPTAETDRGLGRALAALHAAGAATFGREDRRSTGSRGLPNEPCPDWATFYATQRMAPLARLARDAGAVSERALARARPPRRGPPSRDRWPRRTAGAAARRPVGRQPPR